MLQHNVVPVRSAAILTTSYVAGNVIGSDVSSPDIVKTSNQIVLLVDFTIGSLTSAEIKVEFSPDATNWYQESFSSISSGTETVTLGAKTLAASGSYAIALPFKARSVRVSAKGTGTVTSSSMTIKAVVGNV